MMILAVEFSTARRSVALIDAGRAGQPTPLGAVVENDRGATAVEMAEQVLHDTGLRREEVQCLAVSLGPGSYTGIRAAIAFAQGWELVREIAVLGVTATDCLAAQLAATGFNGEAEIAIDAQRKEFYLAGYQISGGSAVLLTPLRIVPYAEVERKICTGLTVIGPQLNEWHPQARALFPEATTLGLVASRRSNFVGAQSLEPVYLRAPDFLKVGAQRSAL